MAGADQGGTRFALAGQFSSLGGALNGTADYDDAGGGSNSSGTTAIASNVFSVASNGRGTASIYITAPNVTIDYVFYVVNSSELIMMALDSTETPPMIMSGHVFAQASGLGNSTLSGTSVLAMADVDQTVGETQGGILTATSSNASFSLKMDDFDMNNGGTGLQSATITGNYSVASNGRMTLSNLSGCPGGCKHNPVFYVFGTNDAFVVGTGGSGQFGQMTAQTGTSFTASSLSGPYMGGTDGTVIDSGSVSASTVTLTSSNETISGASDKNSINGSNPQTTLPGTETFNADYCPATTGTTCGSSSNGRFLVICPSGSSCTAGSLQNIAYAISGTEWVVMNADSGDDHPKFEDFHQ